MSRRHADPIQVLRRDGVPTQFLWRARLYLVRGVLAEWVESAPWWRSSPARALHTGEQSGPAETWLGGTPGTDLDRQHWRVEAAPGRNAPVGVFDLTYAESGDHWYLAVVHD